MQVEIHCPTLPESVAVATLINLHVKPGQAVQQDEQLCDIETDKVILEVVAPSAGVIEQIMVSTGDSLAGGQVLMLMEQHSEVPDTVNAVANASTPAKPIPEENDHHIETSSAEKPERESAMGLIVIALVMLVGLGLLIALRI